MLLDLHLITLESAIIRLSQRGAWDNKTLQKIAELSHGDDENSRDFRNFILEKVIPHLSQDIRSSFVDIIEKQLNAQNLRNEENDLIKELQTQKISNAPSLDLKSILSSVKEAELQNKKNTYLHQEEAKLISPTYPTKKKVTVQEELNDKTTFVKGEAPENIREITPWLQNWKELSKRGNLLTSVFFPRPPIFEIIDDKVKTLSLLSTKAVTSEQHANNYIQAARDLLSEIEKHINIDTATTKPGVKLHTERIASLVKLHSVLTADLERYPEPPIQNSDTKITRLAEHAPGGHAATFTPESIPPTQAPKSILKKRPDTEPKGPTIDPTPPQPTVPEETRPSPRFKL